MNDIIESVHHLGAYIDRIPNSAMKMSYREQIMKRLAQILLQLDGGFE